MYKIKTSVIKSLAAKKLSRAELGFITYIAQYQDVSGIVQSVYYKDVCAKLGMSVQTFYNILRSLKKKGIIYYTKNTRDYTVHILNNSFINYDYANEKEGYLKVAAKNFDDKKYQSLKAGAQMLLIYMDHYIHGSHMLLNNFYTEICGTFNLTKNTIRTYIHDLKKCGLLFVSKKRNKSYNYEIVTKKSPKLDKPEYKVAKEKELYAENIKQMIAMTFGTVISLKESEKEIAEVADIAKWTKFNNTLNFGSTLKNAIRNSFSQQLSEGKKAVKLNAAFVSKNLAPMIA